MSDTNQNGALPSVGAPLFMPIPYPPWMDGRYVSAACAYRYTQITPPGVVGTVLVPADSRRWCMWLTSSLSGSMPIYCDLFPSGVTLTYAFGSQTLPAMIRLWDYGAIVTRTWMTDVSLAQPVTIHELYGI